MQGCSVLADIGGSSSRWAINSNGAVEVLTAHATWPGANSVHGAPTELFEHLQDEFRGRTDVEKVIIHAAGCGTDERRTALAQALSPIWPGATITVHSDLLGAGLALWGKENGALLILGTGMNAGSMRSGLLDRTIPSLGYVLGDEGSGADIGKRLFHDALTGMQPKEVRTILFGQNGPDLQEVLDATYTRSGAARYLASPVKRAAEMAQHPYIKGLVKERFDLLAEMLVIHFPNGTRLRAAGSVAMGFRDLLTAALGRVGITLEHVIADPLPGLIAHYWPAAGHSSH